MSDVNNIVCTVSASTQGESVCTGRCCECANRNVSCFMELEDAHYSDQTLAALIRYHGWRYGDSKRPADGVKRLFSSLTLYAGEKLVVDFDGRNGSPAEIAKRLNASAEQYASQQQAQFEAA